MNSNAGKGDKRRPCQISPEEEELRWGLALGEISQKEFNKKYEQLLKEGKIVKVGSVIRY